MLNDIKRHAGEALADNYELCEKLMRRIGTSKDEQTGLEQAVKELTAQRTESDKDRGIGEPQDVDGERIQEVKIYYKFIGCINQEGHIC